MVRRIVQAKPCHSRRTNGRKSGGEVLARMLEAEGVTRVFGIIDGTYFGLYSSAAPSSASSSSRRATRPSPRTWRAPMRALTGRLGVCMASNGPGVANLAARPRRRAGRGQPRARDHELPAAADRLPRPRRHLPVLRPGRRDPAAWRSGASARARFDRLAEMARTALRALLRRAPGRRPPRRPRERSSTATFEADGSRAGSRASTGAPTAAAARADQVEAGRRAAARRPTRR